MIAGLVLAALVWGVYGRSLTAPFFFDDYESVVDNRSIVSVLPLVGTPEEPGPLAELKNSTTAGRPLVNLSLAVNYQLGALDPKGYRAFNIMLHLLSALLLFATARRILALPVFEGRYERSRDGLALAVAALWALHPIQTEAVAYVSQRTELMASFFYLLAVYFSRRYWTAVEEYDRRRWLVVAAISGLAGAASKEILVTLPVAVLLIDRTLVSGSFRKALASSRALYAGLALSWVMLLWLNAHGPRGASAGFGTVSAPVWWLTQAKALFYYQRLVLWPEPLSIHYAAKYLDSMTAAWPWAVAALGVGVATAALLRRRHVVGLAGAWVFLVLAPTLLVPIATEVMAERRMYLPLAGIILLGVVGIYTWLRTLSTQWNSQGMTAPGARHHVVSVAFVTTGLIIVSAWIGSRRLDDYRDERELWKATVATQPEDEVARYNLGLAYLVRGETKPAIAEFKEAIARDSAYSPALINLGAALTQDNRAAEAIVAFERAGEIVPDDVDLQLNWGVALMQLQRPLEAIPHLERAITLAQSAGDFETVDRARFVLQQFLLSTQVQMGPAGK
jgi:tetratricopeptide (TPR) repeat protein